MTDLADTQSADVTPFPAARRRRWPWVVVVLLALSVALLGWNAILWRPVSSALSDEHDVSLFAYRQWLLSPGTVMIDLRDVTGSASMADVDRNFFKAAEALKDRRFDAVVLAWHGTPKLLFDPDAFQMIGRERSLQNPVYVIRTMQRSVSTLDGAPAFPELSGGWLGVLGAEMDQHNDFHHRWWLDEAAHSIGGEGK